VPRGSVPPIERAECHVTRHATGNSAIFIAEKDQQIVGSISFSQFGRPQLNHTVVVGVNVARDFRAQGVGRELLTHGLSWAKQSSAIQRVELEAISNNLSAIHLYESCGFVREGIKRQAVKKPEGYFDMYVYGLILK
jgi:RimJ/RimL family protein N-acetyltransferase